MIAPRTITEQFLLLLRISISFLVTRTHCTALNWRCRHTMLPSGNKQLQNQQKIKQFVCHSTQNLIENCPKCWRPTYHSLHSPRNNNRTESNREEKKKSICTSVCAFGILCTLRVRTTTYTAYSYRMHRICNYTHSHTHTHTFSFEPTQARAHIHRKTLGACVVQTKNIHMRRTHHTHMAYYTPCSMAHSFFAHSYSVSLVYIVYHLYYLPLYYSMLYHNSSLPFALYMTTRAAHSTISPTICIRKLYWKWTMNGQKDEYEIRK